MKTLLALLLLTAGSAWAQTPDPRDSIIIESKTLYPGAGAGFARVRVYFSNKDTLLGVAIPLEERSLSGGAYGILGYGPNYPSPPRDGDGIGSFVNLLPPPQLNLTVGPDSDAPYHSDSPDTFMYQGTAVNPTGPRRVPPGPTRPLIDILFDSILGPGQFELDSTKVSAITVQFAALGNNNTPVKVNFVKGVITVGEPKKGDMNRDGVLTSSDVVMLLSCAVLGIVPPAGSGFCDLNCDGMATSADLVLELNAVFLGIPFPC